MRCSAAAHLHAISKSLKAVRFQLSPAAHLIKLKQVLKVNRLSQCAAQVSRGRLIYLAKTAHLRWGHFNTHHRKQRGQTSTNCVITPGKLRLLPPALLPPSPGIQGRSPNTPRPHPTRNNFHTFFFKCKKFTQDANQSKRDTGYIQKLETR